MNKHRVTILVILIMVLSCKSFTKFPAIPTDKLTPQNEIKYIYNSDQRDQRRVMTKAMLLSEEKQLKNKKLIAFSDRNALRITRINLLIDSISSNDYQSKYYAGFIFIHGSGLNQVIPDSIAMKKAVELFKDVYENAEKKRDAKFMMEEAKRRLKDSTKK